MCQRDYFVCCSGLLIVRLLPQKAATKRDPFRSNVAENNVLVDEDTIGDGEIIVHVNVKSICQLPGGFDGFAIDLLSDSAGVFPPFRPAGKLTKSRELTGFTVLSNERHRPPRVLPFLKRVQRNASIAKDDAVPKNNSITKDNSVAEDNAVSKDDPIAKDDSIAEDNAVTKDDAVAEHQRIGNEHAVCG